MSRSKKIVGLVLAVVLMLGSFTMAFAAPTDPGAGNYAATVTVTPADTNIEAGGSTTVSVKVTTNFTVGALSVPLFYEKANVTISNVTFPDTGYFTAYTSEDASDAARIFASAGLDSATYGYVMVTYLPAAKASTRVFADEQVLSFTVTALPGAADGTAVNFKTVDASRKTSTNSQGTLYVGFINSDIINAVPTNIEATGLVTSATVTIGSAAAPEIVAKDSTTGFVDTVRKYVYGVTAGDVAANYFEATNGGSLTWDVGTAASTNGTGATVTLKDSNGVEVETYTLIIFGDVDGNGTINSLDISAITLYTQNAGSLNDTAMFAADVDGNNAVNSLDISVVTLYTQNAGSLSVNPRI